MFAGWLERLLAGAGGGSGTTPVASVPEIDASTGLLAIAATAAALMFAWERRRRLSK